MRRAVVAFAPLLVPLIAFACEQDPEANPPTIDVPEAGQFDTVPPDQSVPDAPATGVSVRVVGRAAAPKAGVTVVFHDTTGAVLETKTTGADGRATRAEGARMATALLAAGTARQLVTWTDLEGGDELVVAALEDTTLLGSYDVTVPYFFADAGPFGASRHTAMVGDCLGSGAGLVINVPITADCVVPSNNTVLVRADEDIRTFEDGLGYSFAKNVAAPADGGTIAVSTNDWQHRLDFTVDLTGKPVLGASANLFEIAGATANSNSTAFTLNPAPAVFRTAKGFSDALVAVATVRTATEGSSTSLGERFAPAVGVTSKTFDYAQALPEVVGTMLDVSTPVRPFMSWTAPTTIASTTKGGIAEIQYDSGINTVRWSIIVSPAAMNVRVPALPSPAADAWLPNAEAAPFDFRGRSILFVDAPTIATYAAFRGQAGVVFAPGARFLFTAIPNGTFRVTRWLELPPG